MCFFFLHNREKQSSLKKYCVKKARSTPQLTIQKAEKHQKFTDNELRFLLNKLRL